MARRNTSSFRGFRRPAKATTTTRLPLSPPSPTQLDKFSKRIGITRDSLKLLFEAPEKSEGIKRLNDLTNTRIKEGRTANLRNYRVWQAIDLAYDAPFNQITPTLVGNILRKNLKADEIFRELNALGVNEGTLFSEIEDPEKPGGKLKVLNPSTFVDTIVPLVKSYLTIRTAFLYNERNQYPFMKMEPFVSTQENMIISEVLTQLVEKMAHQYGFPATLRQAILQALMYSMALVFPSEAWHYEEDADDDGKAYIKKEGLRYNIPHPTRTFWDNNYRPSTFNTDTGCEYAGYWRLCRYGDIESNPNYWNKDVIPFGTNWLSPTVSGNYFTELYPCVGTPPWNAHQTVDLSKREDNAARYAPKNDVDKSVFLTDLFMKIRPSDYGLGDWKYNVWFRFIVASDDTIIYAEPLPYAPVIYFGYDADENRSRNTSLALEIIPWQDHLGNVISQIILAARQNNAKIVYYDTEAVSEADIRKMKAQSGDATGIRFIPYSPKKWRSTSVDPKTMFLPIQFPQQDTVTLTNVIGTIINIMERLLGMSANEVGAAGAHVQTAEEIRVISTNTSTRVDYTGSFIDDAFDAWKRQVYYASRAYADEDFVVSVEGVDPDAVKILQNLGFQIGGKYNGKAEVKGKRSKLTIEAFVSSRDGKNRINSPQIAQIMMQTIQSISANPELVQLVGAEQLMSAMNRAAQLAGAPKDFMFKPDSKAKMMAQLQGMNQQLQQMATNIETAAVQQTMKATAPVAQELQKQGQQVEQAGAAIQQVAQQTAQNTQSVQMIAAQVRKLQILIGAALQANQSPSPVSLDGSPPGAAMPMAA